MFVGILRSALSRTPLDSFSGSLKLSPIDPDGDYLRRVRIDQAFPKDTQLFRLPGPCQCGLINPIDPEDAEDSRREEEKQRSKLKKSGWSEAKIDRWLQQQSDNIDRDSQEAPGLNLDLAKSFLEVGEKFGTLFAVVVWTPEQVTDFDYPRVKVRADEFLEFAPRMSDNQLVEISWKPGLPHLSGF